MVTFLVTGVFIPKDQCTAVLRTVKMSAKEGMMTPFNWVIGKQR